MNNNELYHYGVLGMKWGKRKARPTTNANKVASKKKAYVEAKDRLTKARADKKSDVAYSSAKQAYKQAKKDYKTEKRRVNENYKSNFADKFIFNEATSKKINSYMNNGDSLKSARTKTYAQAGATTVLALAALYGATTLSIKRTINQ